MQEAGSGILGRKGPVLLMGWMWIEDDLGVAALRRSEVHPGHEV